MMLRWKNKNPYINFYRETKKVLVSDQNVDDKLSIIDIICNKSYEGNWLFAHPSHKYQGDKIPVSTDNISNNPYFSLLTSVKAVLSSDDMSTTKISKIHNEFAWYSNEKFLQDWAYTD